MSSLEEAGIVHIQKEVVSTEKAISRRNDIAFFLVALGLTPITAGVAVDIQTDPQSLEIAYRSVLDFFTRYPLLQSLNLG